MSRLIIESGNEAGMVYSLRNEAITLGRSASATIQVVDKRVSRQHVVLRQNRDSYFVEDLGSKNGTFINDEPLAGRVKLKSGDRLQIGDTTLVFERDPGEPPEILADTTRSGSVKLVEDFPSSREQLHIRSAVKVREPVTRELLGDPFQRLQMLYQVTDSIRAILDVDELLTKIMDILWSTVAPYHGIILLRDEDENTLEPVVVRVRDDDYDEVAVSKGIVERCMDEQVAILVSDAPSDLRFSANESVIASNVRSVICAPLVCKNEVLGVMYVDCMQMGNVYYTNDELELITGVANQAAMAITNARLYRQAIERQKLEKELEIARSIQMNLLPKGIPQLKDVQVSAMSMPARKVGGDYYDFVPMEDGRTAIVIADVSGKGVPAAILTASIRASIRLETTRAHEFPVNHVVSAINRWTCRDASNNMFVTMVYAIYDPVARTLDYTNAGHCFPLLFKPDGQFRTLETGGCFLGIMEQIEYEHEVVQLEPGDTLVFYTDGVTDAHSTQMQIFGSERLIETIRENLHVDPEELRDEIYERTLLFRGRAEQFDDMTIMVAAFQPTQ